MTCVVLEKIDGITVQRLLPGECFCTAASDTMVASMPPWIDSHCHLDAPEFDGDRAQVRQRARQLGVVVCVLPAVAAGNFDTVRLLAHHFGDVYALGIHPLYVARAQEADLALLDQQLQQYRNDPRLVAVGEIGLDYFVPALCTPQLRERQEYFYQQQLRLAVKHGLPVILHVRRSADQLLQSLRRLRPHGSAWSGIAHAFAGSLQQANGFLALGLKLGFGGAMTHGRALQLRRLAGSLPLDALVLETDAPDIPPHWLYRTAADRAAGMAQGRNEPGELPRVAVELAALRALDCAALAAAAFDNTLTALPKLRALLV
jgi:TatD DNase family protein